MSCPAALPSRPRRHVRALGGAIAAVVAGGIGIVATPGTAHARVPVADYQMPFVCNQVWTGSTRSTHSPSALSIDWNRDNDLGRRVVASAPGVVSKVVNLGSRSYGLYVVLDHGNGESTLHAHLSAEHVTVGQRVDAGEVIGAVGSSGGSTGPHLHYEQKRSSSVVAPYFDGVAFRFPSTLKSTNCPDVPVVGDWNADGKDDLGTFSRKTYGWFNQLVAGKVTSLRHGVGPDRPLVGDWDGDGKIDLGRRNATAPVFVLRPTAASAPTKITFGAVDDRPVVGDWDGNGTTEIGTWRPSTATFSLRQANGNVSTVRLGAVSHLPVTGDWNGDGITDLGTFDPATAVWSLRVVAKDGVVWTATTTLGAAGDLPAPGDWNGDGVTDLGTWSPRTAVWTQRHAAKVAGGTARIVRRTFGAPR